MRLRMLSFLLLVMLVKPVFALERIVKGWSFIKIDEEYRLSGEVFNHIEFDEGELIFTSPLQKIVIDKQMQQGYVLTEGGGRYYFLNRDLSFKDNVIERILLTLMKQKKTVVIYDEDHQEL